QPEHAQRPGRAYQSIEDVYQAPLGFYERSLAWVMDHRPAALGFSLAILLGTFVLFVLVPKGFIPSEDQGRIVATTETAEGTSYDSMVRHQQAVAAIVQGDPNVLAFMSSVGAGGSNS